MEVILHRIRHAFRRVLDRYGYSPDLSFGGDIEVEYDPDRMEYRFRLKFNGAAEYHFLIRDDELRRYGVEILDRSFSIQQLTRRISEASMDLWSQVVENHYVQRQLRAQCERMYELQRNRAPAAEVRQAHDRLLHMEEHARRFHGRGLIHVTGPQQERLYRELPRIQRHIDERMRGMMLTGMWLDESPPSIGTPAAQKRGQELLESHLSTQQLRTYRKSHYFYVVGCDTGARYQINQGRQMNIYEVDKRGNRRCGWCFLPSGGLVEGDVMLGQKIALETRESEALAVANQFGC